MSTFSKYWIGKVINWKLSFAWILDLQNLLHKYKFIHLILFRISHKLILIHIHDSIKPVSSCDARYCCETPVSHGCRAASRNVSSEWETLKRHQPPALFLDCQIYHPLYSREKPCQPQTPQVTARIIEELNLLLIYYLI